jgi:hypothetical protein
VQGEELDPAPTVHACGASDGVGDVVQLEIEEDAEAQLVHAVDRGRPGLGVELHAHLHRGEPLAHAPGKGLGLGEPADVEGEHEAFTRGDRTQGFGDSVHGDSNRPIRSATRAMR